MKKLLNCDPEIATIIDHQNESRSNQLNFIASENSARPSVLTAIASSFTDKYAEGYPGKRYYPGCQEADALESLTIRRAKELFGAEYANVQPHSGSQANMAVLFSVLEPGDTLMGMSLAAGGHLTHGHTVSFSGKFFKSVQYTVNPATEYIEYDAIEELAHTHKPKIIIAGASSYSRTLNFERFRQIADALDAYLLVDIAHTAGLIITQNYPDPVPYADFITGTTQKTLRGPRGGFILAKKKFQEQIDRAVFPLIQGGPALNIIAGKAVTFYQAQQPKFKDYIDHALSLAQVMARSFEKKGYKIVSGGTDTHLFVVDLTSTPFSGKETEKLLEKVGILASRSAIPFDQKSPLITSGIRLGTLDTAGRGLTLEQALETVTIIDTLLKNPTNPQILTDMTNKVKNITRKATLLDC